MNDNKNDMLVFTYMTNNKKPSNQSNKGKKKPFNTKKYTKKLQFLIIFLQVYVVCNETRQYIFRKGH